MIARGDINRIGRWLVLVDGEVKTKHNEQKEAQGWALYYKHNNPDKKVIIMPPMLKVVLIEEDTQSLELVEKGENVKMT